MDQPIKDKSPDSQMKEGTEGGGEMEPFKPLGPPMGIEGTHRPPIQYTERPESTDIMTIFPHMAPPKKRDRISYMRYTPSEQQQIGASAPKERIIQMVEEQRDPMEPARFRTNQKLPKPPPSPPAPVLHSPTKKPTALQLKEWKIPPCISNWKNPRGYVVPLDKRLMADGRGLQQVHINENFPRVAEALYIAEQKAREAVNLRAAMEQRIAMTKKEEKEVEMREVATRAREERLVSERDRERAHKRRLDEEEFQGYRERETIRRERIEEHRKERNLARHRPDKAEAMKRGRERDITERIALGLGAMHHVPSGESLIDQRLFNAATMAGDEVSSQIILPRQKPVQFEKGDDIVDTRESVSSSKDQSKSRRRHRDT